MNLDSILTHSYNLKLSWLKNILSFIVIYTTVINKIDTIYVLLSHYYYDVTIITIT